jgi:hypothetical protein
MWGHAGPAGIIGGPIEALMEANPANPGVLLAGGAGGVWQFSGSGWTALSDGAPISALAETGNGGILAGAGDLHGAELRAGAGVEFSPDGGATWTQLGGTALAGLAVSQVLTNPGNPQQMWVATVAGGDASAGAQPGVYASSDGGGSWSQVLSGPVWDLALAGSRLLAVGGTALALSTGGGPFVPLALPSQPAAWVGARALAQPDGSFLVALALPSGGVSLWQIDTAGQAHSLPPPPVMVSRRALALAEAPSGSIWVGGQGIAISADGGQTWQTITAPDAATHVLVPMSDGTAWVGDDHGVWRVGPATAPVSFNSGLNNLSLLAAASSAQGMLAAVDGGGVLGLTAAGASEYEALAAQGGEVCGLLASGGTPTCPLADGGPTPPAGSYVSMASGSTGFWLGTSDGRVVDPAGGSHTVGSGPIAALAIADPEVWAAAGSQLFHSTDGGLDWQASLNASAPIAAIAVDPQNASLIALATGAGVEASADGGLTWHGVGGGLTQAPITALVFDANQQLWAATLGRGWWSADFSHASEQVSLTSSVPTVTAGTPLTITAAVTAFGEPVSAGGVQFSAAASVSATWKQNGNAVTFTPQQAGSVSVEASYGTATATLAVPVAAAAPARLAVLAGQNQQQAAGTVLQQPIVIEVDDAFGNPVPGVTVNLTGADFSNAAPVTGSDGRVSVSVRLPDTVAPVTLSAEAAGLPAVSWQETAVAAPDYSLVLTPPASAIAPGSAATLTAEIVPTGGFTAPVSLACLQPAAGCTIAPATLTPGQSAVVTIHPHGNQAAETVVIAAADGVHHASADVPLQAFTLSPSSLSITVTAGQSSAPAALELSSIHGLSGAVSLQIGGLPANLSAVFQPTTPALASGAGATVQVSLLAASGSRGPAGWLVLLLGMMAACLRLRPRRRRWVGVLAASLLAAGCGGGAPSPPPPAAVAPLVSSYNLQVTATVSGLSAAVPLTVNVISH